MSRLNHIFTCVALLACLCWVSSARGKVIYVDDDAAGVDYGGSSNNGSSWDHAFIYLQQALLAAGAGDEIRVAQGLYRPDRGLPPEFVPSRSGHGVSTVSMEGWTGAVFSLKNGVTLMGGFAGLGAEDPNARDPQRYETILSGDLRGNDVDVRVPGNPLYEALRADNSFYVVQSTEVDATAVLDGFVIEAAVSTGFFNRGGSPSIANCVFRGNSAANPGGAGLRCEGGQPTLSNCLFQDNRADGPGGGALHATGAQLNLSDSRFARNWANQEGGAICAVDSDLALTRCTFENNGAQNGGAIHQTAGTLTLVECTFQRNVANNGGAVSLATESASLTRCVFRKNWATHWGGALGNEGGESPLTLERCVFSGNTAEQGGALYASWMRWSRVPGSGTAITQCFFTGNRAFSSAGALASGRVEFTVRGCTFAGNEAPVASTLGWSTVWEEQDRYQFRIENCIVWDGGGSIAPSMYGGRLPPTVTEKQPVVVIRYCDVQAGWPGEGNIDADPCFAAPGHWVDGGNPKIIVDASHPNAAWVEGDYHLKSQAGRWDPPSQSWVLDDVTSPCIDVGDPNSPIGDEPEPNGGRINLGAYGGTAEASKSP